MFLHNYLDCAGFLSYQRCKTGVSISSLHTMTYLILQLKRSQMVAEAGIAVAGVASCLGHRLEEWR